MGFDQGVRLVSRKSLFGWGSFIADRMERAMRTAANFASSHHAAAHRVDAFDIRSEHTRRTMCAGSAARLFSTFPPQLGGPFVLPASDSPSCQTAPGNVSADEELSEDREM